MQSKELRDYDNIPLLGYANKRYWNSPIVRTQEHLEAKRVAVTWIPAAAPLIALALFVVTAIHVRLAYGQWPMDAIDKPATVLLALNMALFAVVSAVSMFLAGPVWLTLLFFPSYRLHFASHVLQAITLIFGWVAFFWVPFAVDPKYVTWLLD